MFHLVAVVFQVFLSRSQRTDDEARRVLDEAVGSQVFQGAAVLLIGGDQVEMRLPAGPVTDAWKRVCANVALDDAECAGVPIEQIQEGIRRGVAKINVDTDGRIAVTGAATAAGSMQLSLNRRSSAGTDGSAARDHPTLVPVESSDAAAGPLIAPSPPPRFFFPPRTGTQTCRGRNRTIPQASRR